MPFNPPSDATPSRGGLHGALPPVHAVVEAAARGELPEWAVAGAKRRAHMGRVAELLDIWAAAMGLSERERVRWRAAGHLHDALRDERPEALRSHVPEPLRALPGALLHGPAAAALLRSAGVEDEGLLAAVSYHTLGEPGLDALGRALYAADFLDPGRTFLEEWRAELRARMPGDFDAVLVEIARARIDDLRRRGSQVLPQTTAFWDALASEAR